MSDCKSFVAVCGYLPAINSYENEDEKPTANGANVFQGKRGGKNQAFLPFETTGLRLVNEIGTANILLLYKVLFDLSELHEGVWTLKICAGSDNNYIIILYKLLFEAFSSLLSTLEFCLNWYLNNERFLWPSVLLSRI